MSKPPARRNNAMQIYRMLLFAYPRAFRCRYGEEMAQMFAACCTEARVRGRSEVARLWLHTCADLLISAAREWAQVASAPAARAPLRLVLTVLLVGLLFELTGLRLLSALYHPRNCLKQF
jgi:hypothetical protein